MSHRRTAARALRANLAEHAYVEPHAEAIANGDESGQPGYIANYSKGLPHDDLGHVDPHAYGLLLRALCTGKPEDFERIPLDPRGGRRLTNPQAGLAFDLEGPDGHALGIRPAPRIGSAENAGEMGELYWMALARDVHFSDYDSHQTTKDAAKEIDGYTDFRGPRDENGDVTPATLFRGNTPGDAKGPYLSQFLLKDVQFGTLRFDQRQGTVKKGTDFMTDFPEWRAVQRGAPRELAAAHRDGIRRYIRNGRDLAHYVHFDALYEAYFNACLILLDLGAPVDPGNPYEHSVNQAGFGTYGGPHILTLVTEVATRALKAVWYQKWFVHRRLRPEAFGGRIDNHLSKRREYPGVIPDEILDSDAVARVQAQFGGSALLPQAFPEGSPTHPAYGAGHATVAGACVTILKAWFDERWVMPQPVEANADGTALVPYTGPDAGALTVGGELDKVAANIAIGRNMGGVHWRSDYSESVRLGETIAIGMLREQKETTNEDSSLSLTRFDGSSIVI